MWASPVAARSHKFFVKFLTHLWALILDSRVLETSLFRVKMVFNLQIITAALLASYPYLTGAVSLESALSGQQNLTTFTALFKVSIYL